MECPNYAPRTPLSRKFPAGEQKVLVSRGTKSGTVGGRMHVRDVSADGQMNGDWNASAIGCGHNAGRRVARFRFAAGQELAGSFAIADAGTRGIFGNVVELLAGFAGHAKLTCVDASVDVLRSASCDGDFEIVNHRSAVHGDAGYKSAFD